MMKHLLIGLARRILRMIPLSIARREQLRDASFLRFPGLFQHMPAYQLWSLQNPQGIEKKMRGKDLPAQRATFWQRFPQAASSQAGCLMVSHNLGGGTESHVAQLSHRLADEGLQVWSLRALGREWVRLMPMAGEAAASDGLLFHLPSEYALLVTQLKALNLQQVHVHHLMDFPQGFWKTVQQFCHDLQLPYDFTVHDYFTICPRYALYDEGVRGYCGEPSVKRCGGCVSTYGSVAGKSVDVAQWRADYAQFLQQARHVFTPNADVLQRMQRYVPQARFLNRPHWDDEPVQPVPPRAHKPGEKWRILVVGAIAPHKGSHVLYQCAEDAHKRQLPLEFTLIGFSDIDWRLKPYATITGAYNAEDLPALLAEGQYDIAFFPAVQPETFNYTLSETLCAGLFPLCFDIGAIAQRVAEIGYGAVLPYADYCYPERINAALIAHASARPEANKAQIESAAAQYHTLLADYYQ